jgi:hypothetical protein
MTSRWTSYYAVGAGAPPPGGWAPTEERQGVNPFTMVLGVLGMIAFAGTAVTLVSRMGGSVALSAPQRVPRAEVLRRAAQAKPFDSWVYG